MHCPGRPIRQPSLPLPTVWGACLPGNSHDQLEGCLISLASCSPACLETTDSKGSQRRLEATGKEMFSERTKGGRMRHVHACQSSQGPSPVAGNGESPSHDDKLGQVSSRCTLDSRVLYVVLSSLLIDPACKLGRGLPLAGRALRRRHSLPPGAPNSLSPSCRPSKEVTMHSIGWSEPLPQPDASCISAGAAVNKLDRELSASSASHSSAAVCPQNCTMTGAMASYDGCQARAQWSALAAALLGRNVKSMPSSSTSRHSTGVTEQASQVGASAAKHGAPA